MDSRARPGPRRSPAQSDAPGLDFRSTAYSSTHRESLTRRAMGLP